MAAFRYKGDKGGYEKIEAFGLVFDTVSYTRVDGDLVRTIRKNKFFEEGDEAQISAPPSIEPVVIDAPKKKGGWPLGRKRKSQAAA